MYLRVHSHPKCVYLRGHYIPNELWTPAYSQGAQQNVSIFSTWLPSEMFRKINCYSQKINISAFPRYNITNFNYVKDHSKYLNSWINAGHWYGIIHAQGFRVLGMLPETSLYLLRRCCIGFYKAVSPRYVIIWLRGSNSHLEYLGLGRSQDISPRGGRRRKHSL